MRRGDVNWGGWRGWIEVLKERIWPSGTSPAALTGWMEGLYRRLGCVSRRDRYGVGAECLHKAATLWPG